MDEALEKFSFWPSFFRGVDVFLDESSLLDEACNELDDRVTLLDRDKERCLGATGVILLFAVELVDLMYPGIVADFPFSASSPVVLVPFCDEADTSERALWSIFDYSMRKGFQKGALLRDTVTVNASITGASKYDRQQKPILAEWQ